MPVKPMEFTIDQNDGNVAKSNGTAAVMSDIYTYKVPRHTVIELRPGDILSAYLEDAAAEAVATDPFELVVRDPNSLTQEVVASGQYAIIKEFQDNNKTKKLGQSRLIKSDFRIVLRVKATTVLVNASCYFQLTPPGAPTPAGSAGICTKTADSGDPPRPSAWGTQGWRISTTAPPATPSSPDTRYCSSSTGTSPVTRSAGSTATRRAISGS